MVERELDMLTKTFNVLRKLEIKEGQHEKIIRYSDYTGPFFLINNVP